MENASEKLKGIYTRLFANKYYIFLFGFIIITLPSLIRGFYLHGQESYFYYRISDFIINNGIPNYDFLSFGGRAFLYNLGSSLFLVLTNLLGIGLNNLLVFLPLVFGFLSLILFYNIVKFFKFSNNILSFACYILILSPAFLYTFTQFTSFTVPLFLNLLGFFLITRKKIIFHYLAFVVYLILPMFRFVHILFGLLILLFYFYKIEKLKKFLPYSAIILLTIYLNNLFVGFGLDIIPHSFYELFFDFGGTYGLSIFLLFLAFFGLTKLWAEKYKHLFYYLFFVLSILIIALNIKYLIYFNLILCILAALGLRHIYQLKWSSKLIRNLTVMLLIIGVLFSGLSFLIENSKKDVDDNLYDALMFLKSRTSPRGVIFSHEKYGIYINTISQRKNFIDFNYAYAPRLDLRLFYLDKIYYSRDLTKVLHIFKEFRVSHILITPEMKDGLVWNTNNNGLLFLLKNNPDNFNLIYNNNGYEIWGIS